MEDDKCHINQGKYNTERMPKEGRGQVPQNSKETLRTWRHPGLERCRTDVGLNIHGNCMLTLIWKDEVSKSPPPSIIQLDKYSQLSPCSRPEADLPLEDFEDPKTGTEARMKTEWGMILGKNLPSE